MSGEGTADCVAGKGVGIEVCRWLSKQLARAEEQWQLTGEAFSCPYAWMGASRAGLEAGERASQQSKTGERQWMVPGLGVGSRGLQLTVEKLTVENGGHPSSSGQRPQHSGEQMETNGLWSLRSCSFFPSLWVEICCIVLLF